MMECSALGEDLRFVNKRQWNYQICNPKLISSLRFACVFLLHLLVFGTSTKLRAFEKCSLDSVEVSRHLPAFFLRGTYACFWFKCPFSTDHYRDWYPIYGFICSGHEQYCSGVAVFIDKSSAYCGLTYHEK